MHALCINSQFCMGTDFGKHIRLPKMVPLGGPLLARGDHFWLPKLVRGDHFFSQKRSGGTSFSAKIGPAGPILGGTDFGVTVPRVYTRVKMKL